MPDPSIKGFGGTNSGANVTSTTVDIVTRVGGTPRIGDLVIIGIVKDGTGAFTWPAGWTSLNGFPVTFAAANNQGVADVRYRIIQDGDNLSPVITHASEGTAHQVYWIDGTGPLQLIAPESQVATGDSTNPDPPSITPSWGARTNTLYLVFAGNDGNTAITAAPTNYTNFQNDRWANTNGVGIASARRLTNSSTENPNAFTMATEQWFASIAAIDSGPVLTEPLNREQSNFDSLPDRFARKSAGLDSLSITSNLLESTLAPIDNIPPVGIFGVPDRKIGLLVGIESRLVDDADKAFIPIDYPNPKYKEPLRLSWLNNSLQNTLKPEDTAPFISQEWANPKKRRTLLTRTISRLVDDANIAFSQLDWPNPKIKNKIALTWLNDNQNNVLIPITQNPFYQTNWPNPQLKKRTEGFTLSRPQFYQDIQPFNQKDWPNPFPKKFKYDTWIINLLEITLFVAPTKPPSGGEFTVPFRKATLLPSIYTLINSDPPVKPPVYPITDNLAVRKLLAQSWIQNRPFYYNDIKPFNQNDYPNPRLRPNPPNTWLFSRKIDEPVPQSPFVNFNFENPRIQGKINRGFTVNAAFQQTFTNPIATPFDKIPVVKAKPIAQTIIQQKPFYYVSPTSIPSKQTDWPLPSPRKKTGTPWIDYFILDASPAPTEKRPAFTYEVLIPSKPPIKSYAGHIDYFALDGNTPSQPFQSMNRNPLRKKLQNQGFANNGLTSSAVTSLPSGKQTFINPLVKKISALSWLQNSLSVVQLPIIKYDYPNPQLKKYVTGFTQNRPFFYNELLPSLQIQEWPTIIYPRKSNAGYIFIPKFDEANPINPYDLSIPKIGKRILEGTFINLLQSTLTPAAGNIPFLPLDYPNPIRSRRLLVRVISKFLEEAFAPIVPYDNSNPVIKTKFNVGWIKSGIIQIENPQSGTITGVPLRKKVIALTGLVNLQQSNLNPIPQASLSQKDWPNPLRGRNNQVGFLNSIIDLFGEGAPFKSIIYDVYKKNISNFGYIDNKSLALTDIIGDLPFNQFDWPIFRPVEYPIQGTIVRGYILPIIIGRGICLLADDTDYDLEASEELFDLDARMTDYKLEAGGDSCE